MATQTQTVTRDIHAEPDRVWKVLTDVGSAPQTLSNVHEVETSTDGPYRIGSRWRQTRTVHGERVTQEVEVTAMEALGLTTVVARGSDAETPDRTTTYHLTALHPGTRVTLSVEGDDPSEKEEGVLRKALHAVTSTLGLGDDDPELEQDLADLAAAAESDTPARG